MPARELRDQREEDQVVEEQEQETPLNPLLIDLPEDIQEKIVAVVMEDYRNGMEARMKTDWGTDDNGNGVDFETKYADLIDLYEGQDEKRPERWMCGRSLKISQAIVELLVARLLPAVWNENTVRWRPVEFTDKKRVERLNKIMFWVVNVWMKFGRKAQEYVRSCIMLGTVYSEAYWYVKKRDTGSTEKIPLTGEDGQPLLDENGEPMVVEEKLLEIDEHPDVRFYPPTDVITQPGQTDIQEEPIIVRRNFYYHELEQMQREGIAQNITDELKGKIDNKLHEKFGEELAKAEKIADKEAKRRSYCVECLFWYGNYDIDGDGINEDVVVLAALHQEVFIRAIRLSDITRTGERPIRKTNYVDRIFKLLGIGVLEQVKPLAEEIDACFRQLQDANTMSILRWGFYDPNSDYSPDEHVAKPRAMYPVSNPAQNVYFPDINIPVERLLNAIRLVLEFIERLTAASSFMLGKESEIAGGSGTATRTQIIASSAETRFNLPAMNMREGIGQILTDIFNLCQMNMPTGLERRILGENGELVFESSDEIQDAFSIEADAYMLPNADFGDINTARELAVLLYDKFVLGGNPLIVGDMNRLWHATANVFKSYGENPVEWIGKPQTKKESNDPVDEHTMIREGRVVSPEPQENHLEHMIVHQQFLQELEQSEDVILWSNSALQALRIHIQEHQQMMSMIMNFQQTAKKGGDLGGQEPGGGSETGAPGRPRGANGEQSISSDANPTRSAPDNQTAGTTQGTPAVR